MLDDRRRRGRLDGVDEGGRKAREVIVSVWLSTYCRIGAVEGGLVRFLLVGWLAACNLKA